MIVGKPLTISLEFLELLEQPRNIRINRLGKLRQRERDISQAFDNNNNNNNKSKANHERHEEERENTTSDRQTTTGRET
jgi:hypothetical protein